MKRAGYDTLLFSAINISPALMLVILCNYISGLFLCVYEIRTCTLEILSFRLCNDRCMLTANGLPTTYSA